LSGWKVTLVHGPDHEDIETLSTLQAAMDWASTKGAEYHRVGVDCLGLMITAFVFEKHEDGKYFQYGTNYHWVVFEKA
jgi:hypothetical protein